MNKVLKSELLKNIKQIDESIVNKTLARELTTLNKKLLSLMMILLVFKLYMIYLYTQIGQLKPLLMALLKKSYVLYFN